MLCGYLQTVFAAPNYWWWGIGVPFVTEFRWSILMGIGVLASVFLNRRVTTPEVTQLETLSGAILGLSCLNVAFVHFILADSPEMSWFHAQLYWKTAVLLFLLFQAIRNISDLKLVLLSIFLGCTYIGFEVVVREQGYFEKGRLEGIALPGASDSNLISGILAFGLLIGGYFALVIPTLWKKALFVLGSVLILETILRSNSRGCYLSLIASGIAFLFFSTGRARTQAAVLGTLGAAAILVMAKNEAIWERFYSIFVSSEERDLSSQSRIDFWKSAIHMISDYPLGSGGEAAFMSPRGKIYISHLDIHFRAVHNGFLDTAASWGIQGLFFFAVLSISCLVTAFFAIRRAKELQDYQATLLFALLISIAIGQLVTGMFLSSLDCEVPMISLVFCLLSWRLYRAHSDLQAEEVTEDVHSVNNFEWQRESKHIPANVS
jgi:O-antigen ligase